MNLREMAQALNKEMIRVRHEKPNRNVDLIESALRQVAQKCFDLAETGIGPDEIAEAIKKEFGLDKSH